MIKSIALFQMYGFKSMLIHLNPKQNILKILDKNSSSIIFLAKIISSKHICAKFCYKYLEAEARAMVYNYYGFASLWSKTGLDLFNLSFASQQFTNLRKSNN